MGTSGGEAIVLTRGEDPSWAPNSRNLVFMRKKNGRKTLSVLDVPTKQVKDIRQTARDQSQPSWAK
jgi:Tol biopolymer transport system component